MKISRNRELIREYLDLELVDPNNPTSSKQHYVLTALEKQMAKKLIRIKMT